MEAVVIVSILAFFQYIFFGFQAGTARGKAGIKAPAMTGDPNYERATRVHQNTLEVLVVLIPTLWMFAHYVDPVWGAGITVVYLVGRFIYRASYLKDPASRSMGFTVSMIPIVVMMVWLLVVAIRSYV